MGVSFRIPRTRLILKDDEQLIPFLLWLFRADSESIWHWLGCRYEATTRTLVIPGGWEKAGLAAFERLMDHVLPILDPAQRPFSAVVTSEDQGNGPSVRRWRYRGGVLTSEYKDTYDEHPRGVWIADEDQRIDPQGRWWHRIHASRGITHIMNPMFGVWRQLTPMDFASHLRKFSLTRAGASMDYETKYGSPNLLLAFWRVAVDATVGVIDQSRSLPDGAPDIAELLALGYLARSPRVANKHWFASSDGPGGTIASALSELLWQPRYVTVCELESHTKSAVEAIAREVAPTRRKKSSTKGNGDKLYSDSDGKEYRRRLLVGLARGLLAVSARDGDGLARAMDEMAPLNDWSSRPEWLALLVRANELGVILPAKPPAETDPALWSWIRGRKRKDSCPDLRADVRLDDLAGNANVLGHHAGRNERASTGMSGLTADERRLTETTSAAPARRASFEAELLAMPCGQTPQWDDGIALIDRLGLTPWSQWVSHRDIGVSEGDPAKMATALRALLDHLRSEWEQPDGQRRDYQIIRDVGGRDVVVTGMWLNDDEVPARNPCDRIRLLEWSGVAKVLGFVDD